MKRLSILFVFCQRAPSAYRISQRLFSRERMTTLTTVAVIMVACASGSFATPAPPPGFAVEEVIVDLHQPMAMRFLPDGRILLIQKQGDIRIVDATSTPATSQLYMNMDNAPNGLAATQERGLLDFAIDPGFPSQPYLYLFYTPGTGIDGQSSSARSRVSRFTHQENSGGLTSRGSLASEVVLWEDTHGYDSCCHFGGGLDFGPDGNLWLTVGDHFQGSYATSLSNAGGKVHRFGKDGSIPADNPLVGKPGLDTVVAYGLRNPFRSRWDLQTNRFFIAEVGGNMQDTAWEDLHAITWDPGAGQYIDEDYGTVDDNAEHDVINFGWPTVEGLPPHTDWPEANIDSVVGEPIFAWKHNGLTSAITGGVVARSNQFPLEYQNVYFFGDSTRDFVRYLAFDESGNIVTNPNPDPISSQNPDSISFPFDLSPIGRIVDFKVGPDGALYYVSFTDSGGAYGEPNPAVLGSIRRYVYDGTNQFPVISDFSVSPADGPSPLSVLFNIEAFDPDSDPISYYVDFGDGANSLPAETLAGTATQNHTYTADGVYKAILYVDDGLRVVSSSLSILVGNPPTITSLTAYNPRTGLLTEPDDEPLLFQFGDTITFTGAATDLEDGPLFGGSFVWNVTFVRPGNLHPTQGPDEGVASIDFAIPSQGQGFSGPVYYQTQLDVEDSSGLQSTETIDIYPQKASIHFDTVPSGIVIQVNGNTAVPAPYSLDTLVNWDHTISVPSTTCVGSIQYTFDHWSSDFPAANSSTNNPLEIIMPEVDIGLTAVYVATGPCSEPPQAGLTFHIAADQGTSLDGNNVTAWADQSDAGHVLQVQGAPSLQSDQSLNNTSFVHFDGVDDALFTDSLIGFPTGNEARTVAMLARYNQIASGGGWAGFTFGDLVKNKAFGVTLSGDGYLGVQGWGLANDIYTDPLFDPLGQWTTHVAVLSADVLEQYVNGEPAGTAQHLYDTASVQLRLGEELNGRKNLNMDVAEVLVYNRELSQTELDQLNSYLDYKYFNDQPNSSPTVVISNPADGSTFAVGHEVTFSASAIDVEDGDISAVINWSSDLDGAMGIGASLSYSVLSAGTHTITAAVTDSGGRLSTSSINVTISEAVTVPASAIRLFDGQTLNDLTTWLAETGFDDPEGKFSVIGETLRIQGNGLGSIATDSAYRDYIMVLEFKWGDETWGVREGKAKDAGVVVHSTGNLGEWNGFLMPGIQSQVMEGGMGDLMILSTEDQNYSLIADVIQLACGPNTAWNCRGGYVWDTAGVPTTFDYDVSLGAHVHTSIWDPNWEDVEGFRGEIDIESPDGDWNQMIVVSNGAMLEVYFNGLKVNEATSLTPAQGALQLEMEWAEYFVRRWDVLPLGSSVEPLISTTSIPGGVINQAYSSTVKAVGLDGPFEWSVFDGVLPPGLSLGTTNGVLSGTPNVSGTYGFTIEVSNSVGLSAAAAFTIQIETSPNETPTVDISAPADGSTFVEGQLINFTASANDPEDGDLSGAIAWSSDLDGTLGTGASMNVDQLSVGEHLIRASVTDSDLNAGEASVSVTISALSATLITEGLVLQLESDLNVSLQSGSTVAGWLDQSGEGNDMVANGEPQIGAILTPSGLPAISFDGQNDSLERIHAFDTLSGLPTGNADRTMFVVASYNNASRWGGAAYGNGSFNEAFGLGVQKDVGNLFLHGYGGSNDLVSNVVAFGAGWIVHSGLLSSGTASHYLDGAQLGQFSHTYNTTLKRLVIGEETKGLGFIHMDVAAVLIYNRALTPTERAQVESYLQEKYLNAAP